MEYVDFDILFIGDRYHFNSSNGLINNLML